MSAVAKTLGLPSEAGRPEVFRDALLKAGVLIDGGTPGLYLRSGPFETVARAVEALMRRQMADDGAEEIHPQPGMTTLALGKSGYMRSFPQLAGTVGCFCGDDADHRRLVCKLENDEDWTDQQIASEVSLIPAACYPTYSIVAARGPLPADGHRVAITSWCFRHEPSPDPCRMQMFRMAESVRYGTPEQARAHRELWMGRVAEAATMMGLPHTIEPANDPFFGRTGRLMATSQLEQELKMELLIPVSDETKPTACASVNMHLDGMGLKWGITTPDGEPAHTACVGYGLERMSLALFRHHGAEPRGWPASVRAALWP